MRGTNQRGACAVAEKLRVAIEQLQMPSGLTSISVTASFGVAKITAEDQSLASVLARADNALYRAKAGGRNCIRSS